jgi:hypothetical protein
MSWRTYPRVNLMKWVLFSLGILFGGLGVAAFVRGWIDSNAQFVQGGSVIVGAALVTITAAVGVDTWAQQRRRAHKARQEDIYAELIVQLVSRFSPAKYNFELEHRLRSQVATWGGPAVIRALGSWNEDFDTVAPSGGPMVVDLTLEQQELMRAATARVAHAVREDLSLETVATNLMEMALFNEVPRVH